MTLRLLSATAFVIVLATVSLTCTRDREPAAGDSGQVAARHGDPASHAVDSVRSPVLRADAVSAQPESIALRVGEKWPVTRLRVRVLDARGRQLPDVPVHVIVADSAIATLRRFQLEGVAPGRTTLEIYALLPRSDRPPPATRVPVRVSP